MFCAVWTGYINTVLIGWACSIVADALILETIMEFLIYITFKKKENSITWE